MKGIEINQSEGTSYLEPFFITANRGETVPATVIQDFIRLAFNDSIYPPAKISIAALKDEGETWEAFAVTKRDHKMPAIPPELQEQVGKAVEARQKKVDMRAQKWRELFKWYAAHKEFRDARFVMIGENPLSKTNFGCAFPRLVVGLTDAGSLVGICGHSIQT
jgi:hypothetical protein